MAVNRARQGTSGGENKSDPRDARVIADQMRLRDDLRPVASPQEYDITLRLLTTRREELVEAQTRRVNRLRNLLCGIHPGLERVVDPVLKADLMLLSRNVTPTEVRRAGVRRVTAFLVRQGVREKKAGQLAAAAHAAALEQTSFMPCSAIDKTTTPAMAAQPR